VFNLLQNVRALGMDIEPMLKKLGINVVTDLGLTSAPHQVPPAKAGE
jgi:hypothetical protein